MLQGVLWAISRTWAPSLAIPGIGQAILMVAGVRMVLFVVVVFGWDGRGEVSEDG